MRALFQSVMKDAGEFIALISAGMLISGSIIGPRDLKFLVMLAVGLVYWFQRKREIGVLLCWIVLSGVGAFSAILWFRGFSWLEVFLFGQNSSAFLVDLPYIGLYLVFLLLCAGVTRLIMRRRA